MFFFIPCDALTRKGNCQEIKKKKTYLGPIWTGKKDSRNCFAFEKTYDYLTLKSNMYLRENEQVRETVKACSFGAHVDSLKENIEVENLVTLFL